ncbi:hypothetical protein BJ546DRAFT_349204 [Cryomyces antarcticus]|nr:hypothetical protein LTR04_000381 [Oleoguttula sp. CCFEE 6159]
MRQSSQSESTTPSSPGSKSSGFRKRVAPRKTVSKSPYLVLYGVGIFAFALAAACTTITTVLAVRASTGQLSIRRLALAAAATDILALGGLVTFILQFTWRLDEAGLWSRLRTWCLVAAGVLPSILGAILTLATLAWMRARLTQIASSSLGPHTPGLITADFVLWAFAVLSQVGLCALTLRGRSLSGSHKAGLSDGGAESLPEVGEQTPPVSLETYTQPHGSQKAFTQSPAVSSDPRESLRLSVQQILRPVTSKTRLLGRQSSVFQDSKSVHSTRPSSMDSVRPEDGFDAWDTSSVDPRVRDTVMQSGPSRGTALETIPGSRPASPARALDGPFPVRSKSPNLIAPPLPPFYGFSRPSSQRSSRRPSTADESHIHPLFRTDSPTPPPTATPGTIVTASPFGGQVLTSPIRPGFGRVGPSFGSRPTTPVALVHSPSFSRPGSPDPVPQLPNFGASTAKSPSPPDSDVAPPETLPIPGAFPDPSSTSGGEVDEKTKGDLSRDSPQ